MPSARSCRCMFAATILARSNDHRCRDFRVNLARIATPPLCAIDEKKRGRGRIDGIVVLAMAVGVAEAPPAEGTISIWDRREL
jgi:hypothetical protein